MNPKFEVTVKLVLEASCKQAMDAGSTYVATKSILPWLTTNGISEEDTFDALQFLKSKYKIAIIEQAGFSDHILMFKIATRTFDDYLWSNYPEYGSLVESVKSQIKQNVTDSDALAAAIDAPTWVLAHIIDVLSESRLIDASSYFGGKWRITRISPELKHE